MDVDLDQGDAARGHFYNDPVGSNTQPNPNFFSIFPKLPWDTFMTTTEGWPNTRKQGVIPGFASTPNFGANGIDATGSTRRRARATAITSWCA